MGSRHEPVSYKIQKVMKYLSSVCEHVTTEHTQVSLSRLLGSEDKREERKGFVSLTVVTVMHLCRLLLL